MPFILAGVNIGSSPVELLESVTVSRHELPGWLPRLATHAGGGVILSTCNRTEVYGYAENQATGESQFMGFLGLLAARPRQSASGPDHASADTDSLLSRHAYLLSGVAAARHLFRVTAGLDSLALGEAQVAGQVSHALKAAGEAGVVSPRVSRLFHGALRTSRRIREKTGLGRDRVSVPSIAIHLIERSIGELRTKSALLVGAGETGELVARALRMAGIGHLTVTSRRTERAETLAHELGAATVPFAYKDYALAGADIVVACTSAPDKPVVSFESVQTAMNSRAGRPVFLMDVGMPRDIDPRVAGISGVTLRDLHGLETVAAEHRASRQTAASSAELLIDREVQRFLERLNTLDAEPAVRLLGSHAEQVRQAELARAMKRLPGLSQEQAATVDALTKALVSRLLADPITYLRAAEPDAAEAMLDAFGLPESFRGADVTEP